MSNVLNRQTILVVDDTPENILILRRLLEKNYQVKTAADGETALKIANSEGPPDLILLDIVMPGMDGYEVCRRLKADPATKPVPVIFITGKSDPEDEARGFEFGGVDYITKPISFPLVRARVKTHLALYDQNRALEQKVRERTREIAETQEVTILSLAALAECRNKEIGRHTLRTRRYLRLLAEHLKNHPRFQNQLADETIELLYKSAPLHDLGIVGVPDKVLLKMGKLTPEEEAEMRKHTIYGKEAMAKAEKTLNRKKGSSFLNIAKVLAHTHHENWDGSGYQEGRAGEDIPIAGRLMAVADAYDVLVSQCNDKPPFPHQTAVTIIYADKGIKYDPDIIDAFMELNMDFYKIARELADFEAEREMLAKSGIETDE